MIREVQRPVVHAPAQTTWAHGPGLAAEGDDLVLAAIVAVQVRETPRENSAVQILMQFLRHEFRQGASTGIVGPLLLEGQQVLLRHLVEGSLLRLPARIDRTIGCRPYTCRCLHQGGLSASGSPKVRAGQF
jgi:hypothetical protein